MTPSSANQPPLGRQPEPREPWTDTVFSGLLALIMHGALLAILVIGMQWATKDDQAGTLSVSLWGPGDIEGATGAPTSVDLPPDISTVEVEEAVEQPPLFEVTDAIVEPDIPQPPPVMENPDIALQQQQEVERQKELDRQKEADRVKEVQRLEEEKKKAREKEIAQQKAQADRQTQREQALRESLNRERANLGGDGQGMGTGSGSGRVGSGPGGGGGGLGVDVEAYKRQVAAIIERNTPDWSHYRSERLRVVYRISLLPDGTIGNVVLVSPSGNPAYDQAIRRGIDKTRKVPPPEDWAILPQRYLEIGFRSKE